MRTLCLIVLGVAAGILVATLRRAHGNEERTASAAVESAGPQIVPAPSPRYVPRPRALFKQRDLDTTDARYSAVALSQESAGELSASEIFDSEPRDPVFAPVLETRVKKALIGALDELKLSPKVRSIKAECRTLSCDTRLELSRGDVEFVYDQINGIMLGDVQVPGIVKDGDVGFVTFTNLYRPETRDETYYQRFLDEAFTPALEFAKQRAKGAP